MPFLLAGVLLRSGARSEHPSVPKTPVLSPPAILLFRSTCILALLSVASYANTSGHCCPKWNAVGPCLERRVLRRGMGTPYCLSPAVTAAIPERWPPWSGWI